MVWGLGSGAVQWVEMPPRLRDIHGYPPRETTTGPSNRPHQQGTGCGENQPRQPKQAGPPGIGLVHELLTQVSAAGSGGAMF